MIPVVQRLADAAGSDALWWALAMGADFGGNATIIGASANLILANLAEREGHPIGFVTFLRYGLPVTLGTILLSTVGHCALGRRAGPFRARRCDRLRSPRR